METAMRNVSINDRTTPSMSPIIKTEPSSLQQQSGQLMQDQPLDFSTKVRVQSVIENPEDTSLRKVSNDSAIDCSDDVLDDNRSAAPELAIENQSQPFPSQNRIPSMPMPNISTFLPQSSSSVGAMGMFYPPHPVFPNLLPPGFTAGPMWPNPMAAMLQQQEVARKMLSNSGKSSSAATPIHTGLKPPFGNKQSLMKHETPLLGPGGRPFPSMPPFSSAPNLSNIPDPNILAEAMKSHEEMFIAYKQQILSQKAAEEAKKGARRQASCTTTNGSHSAISNHSNGTSTTASSETFTLSQISEDQTFNSPQLPSATVTSDLKSAEGSTNGISSNRDTQASSSDDDKHSGSSGSVGETGTNGIGHTSGANSSAGPSLHSSDESLQTNDSRRSLTPAHSSNGELNDITGMRPRSMTLPTQSDSRMLSYSPSPSVLSTGNNSSGPGTPNSKNDRGFRKRARTLPDDQKDEAYWERRRKNNEAAKRSRDSRRAKEDEIAIRAAFLEQENIRLRLELAALKTQTAKLRSELVIFQGPEDRGAGPAARSTDGS